MTVTVNPSRSIALIKDRDAENTVTDKDSTIATRVQVDMRSMNSDSDDGRK